MLSKKFYEQNSERLYNAEKEFLKATFEEGKADKVIDAVRNAIRNSSNYVGMEKNYRSVLSAFSIALNHTNDMVRRIGGILYCEPFRDCLNILDKEQINKEDLQNLQKALKKAAVVNKKNALIEQG
jgi:hypothetical protein